MEKTLFNKTKDIFKHVLTNGEEIPGEDYNATKYRQIKINDKLVHIRFCNESGNDNYLRIKDNKKDIFAFIHNRSPLAKELCFMCCNKNDFESGIDAIYSELIKD